MARWQKESESRSKRAFLGATLQGALIAGVIFSWAVSNRLSVTETTVRIGNLPGSFAGFRIAFASDFHYGRYTSIDSVRHAVATINSLNPEIVLLGGDYAAHRGRQLTSAMSELGGLRARHGAYSVPGNHDYAAGIDAYRRAAAAAGVMDITNRGFAITHEDGSLWIEGLDDDWNGRPNFKAAAAGAPPGAPRIFFTHNPALADDMPGISAALILAGHTHGWQVYVPVVSALMIPVKDVRKYRAGFYGTQGGLMYVTRGVGYMGRPIRWWCSPEVVLLTLEPA